MAETKARMGAVVREQRRRDDLDEVGTQKVKGDDAEELVAVVDRERDEVEPLAHVHRDVGRGDDADAHDDRQRPEQGLVLHDALAEGAALIVDHKRGDLHRQRQKVHGAVEQTRLKVLLEVDRGIPSKRSLI